MTTYSGTLTGGSVTTISPSASVDAYVTNARNNEVSGAEDAVFHVTIDGTPPTVSTGLTVFPTQTLRLVPLSGKITSIKILCANALAYSVVTNA